MKDSQWFTKVAAVFTAIGTMIGLIATVKGKAEESKAMSDLKTRVNELEKAQMRIEEKH